MPLRKEPKKSEPKWKKWDHLADKDGTRHTVYAVNGNSYTGEWKENTKHGKGQQVWKKSGAIYDGDWKNDKRNGFGTYSVVREGVLVKEYAGGWKNDERHGYGTRFYNLCEYYEGEWYADERCGWGRMYYADGSIYEGEWFGDKRHGRGLLKLADGNRYEGMWKSDMKNGTGKFFYLDKGQVYTGDWVNDIPVCGTLEDFGRDGAPNPPVYPIPKCTLENPHKVIEDSKELISTYTA